MANSKNKNKNKNKAGRGAVRDEATTKKSTKTQGTEIGNPQLIAAADVGQAGQIGTTQLDTTQSNESRAYQKALADQLMTQMKGEGPSLAEGQYRLATDRAIKQQMGLAQSGAGNPLAIRTALRNQAALSQEAALQSSQLRMAEQLAAYNALNQVSGQMRTNDIAQAGANAELAHNAGVFNVGQQNDFVKAQAALEQQARLGNQSAINAVNAQQATINAQILQSRIGAAASQNAAAAGASASRYATDAGLYKFNSQLAFDMDRYYQGQNTNDINAGYNASVNQANQANAAAQNTGSSLNSFGGAITAYNNARQTQGY